jgi:uncharacterized cupin superfamily protein
MSSPLVTSPVKVVENETITISEYFGRVASADGTASFAVVDVRAADAAAFQTPQFAEYVICNSGAIDLEHSDGEIVRLNEGEGAFLPAFLRLKWKFPGPCNYTVVCMPAFSPELSGTEEGGTVVDDDSRQKLKSLHSEATAPEAASAAAADAAARRVTIVKPVAVVDAPGIVITEHFGHVASRDGTASLGVAVVKAASEEAWQAPQFDEFVICSKGAIDFIHGDGQKASIKAGQGIFLPKALRVKWVWLEASSYFVLCLPAFSPALCGREAEEGATVAKDSASMQRLEALHQEVGK